MKRFVAAEPPPRPWLERTGGRRVHLPTVDRGAGSDSRIRDTLVSGHGPDLSVPSLGRLLWLAFGQTGSRRLPVTGHHPRRTSPSGGSRHPTEAYVLVFNVAGVRPGGYHYSVPHHALDEVVPGDPADFFNSDVVMLKGRIAFAPRVAIVLTSVVERSMFRYRDSRSYRVLYLDVGHLLQNLAYLAAAAGRPSYRGYAMRVSAVARYFRLEPLTEVPIAFGVLG
ncbi:MAG: SagB/ThcOx family dehydrogenase [Candidatus Dormibacteria bacterium]